MLSCVFLLTVAVLQSAVVTDSGWRRDTNVAVPMRDGVVLRADVLRPPGDGRFPVLVYRTPYGKGDALAEYTTFRRAVERGYTVVVQDVRGRYASDGTFDAYRQEGHDGYDTIEWAAAQAWSDGRVGTFGLSYPGAVQWLAAVEGPPHLRAMVPAMTFASPRQFFYSGGAWDLSWASWVWYNIAPDLRRRLNVAGPQTESDARAAWKRDEARVLAQLPLLDLPDFRGVAPWYYDWIRHDPGDGWWNWAELAGKYGRVHAAVLNVSGWHDEAYGPQGAVVNHQGLLAAGKRSALLIGPWVHGVDATARTRSGQREFGPAAVIDYDETVLRWMDRWVRDIDNGVEREPSVRVFAMGANTWRSTNRWPIPGLRAESLFFAPGQALSPRAPSARDSHVATFQSDPAHPVTDPYRAAYGAHDFRALTMRADALMFETAPLATDLEVVGAMRARVFLDTDARDVDLYVMVFDVAPDGAAFNLMSPGLTVVRASARRAVPSASRDPRRGPAVHRDLLTPGKVYELTLNEMYTANRFLAGHRIRVQIMGAFQPHFSLNLQTGESERSSSRMQAARISIHLDQRYPSRLILPVAR